MGASAPYGNKNAEKWTLRKATLLFKDAIVLSNRKTNGSYEFDFIGEIARELGTYHEIFANLVVRFPALKRLKNELGNNIESNCYSNTKKGNIKEATGIVNLKSNWKWTDRVDNTTKDDSLNKVLTKAEIKDISLELDDEY